MSGSTSWTQVHKPLSRVTRVCAYDRPGLDWSEPRPQRFNAAKVAEHLGKLLSQAEITEPLILVGMSAGGVFVRQFQQQHPDRVVGMALVDSSHEQQGNRLPTLEGDNPMYLMLELCATIAPTGLLRVAGVFEGVLEMMKVTVENRERSIALMNRNHTCPAVLGEMLSFDDDIDQTEPPASLGDLPLLVLSQGAEPDLSQLPPGYTMELAVEQQRVWDELQLELVALSSRGRRVIAEKSGHIIQSDQPKLVITELSRLIDEVRIRTGLQIAS